MSVTGKPGAALYLALAENLPNGAVALFDSELRFLIFAGTVLRDLGMSREDLEGGTLAEVCPGEIVAAMEPRFRRTLSGLAERFEIEYRSRCFSVFTEPVRDSAGRVTHGLMLWQDMTERKRRDTENWRLANYDAVTGLANRRLFLDRLDNAVARARRYGNPGALLFIDLDGFKQVNDHHGHDAGDHVLREIATRLRQVTRESDTVARYGGDEFTIVIPEIGRPENARAVAAKVLDAVSAPIPIDGLEVRVTASVGVAFFPASGESAQDVLVQADKAMYRAKDEMKGQPENSRCHFCGSDGSDRATIL